MAISAGSEKLENRTMAENSHFIIGKIKFEYREKQQRLLVLIWNWWTKKKKYEENHSNQKEMHFYESTNNNINNNRNNIRERNIETTYSKWYPK